MLARRFTLVLFPARNGGSLQGPAGAVVVRARRLALTDS